MEAGVEAMTWFGWALAIIYAIGCYRAVADDEKSDDRRTMEFFINAVAVALVLSVGTGHL